MSAGTGAARSTPHARTVVAGTFDRMHAGHFALLHTGFNVAAHVEVWITDDAMTEAKARKVGQPIRSFAVRSAQVFEWLEAQTAADADAFHASTHGSRNASLDGDDKAHPYRGRFTLHALHDPFGPPAVDGSYTSIVCSEETRPGCEKINAMRAAAGLAPLDVAVVPVLCGSDGVKHSSTAIRAAETAVAAATAGGGAAAPAAAAAADAGAAAAEPPAAAAAAAPSPAAPAGSS